MLEIQGLWKSYGGKSPAISDVTFKVNDGEVVGFVGLNGAGKTTTIRVAAGVSLPTKGSVAIDGHDIVNSKAEASRSTGWVPEIPNFEPNMKAISLMKYFCGFYDIPSSSVTTRSAQALVAVGLAGSETKKFSAFSQGMKKRFSLAVSMLSDPQNLLFDEILNGLDPEGIHYFREKVEGLKKEGKAVLLSSHILAEVQALADRVVFIHKGRVIRDASASEISSMGAGVIAVTIQNLDDKALAFLRALGEVKLDGNTVRILSPSAEAAEINSKLVLMGYQVTQILREKTGLEEAFFRLVEDAERGDHG